MADLRYTVFDSHPDRLMRWNVDYDEYGDRWPDAAEYDDADALLDAVCLAAEYTAAEWDLYSTGGSLYVAVLQGERDVVACRDFELPW